MRAIWEGAISFGLVSIPVKLYSSTKPKQVELHTLCPVCHSPLQYKRWCPKCGKEVKWKDVVKGFKITKEKWVIIEKKDLEKIKIPTTKTIEIEYFVDAGQIDPIYFQKTYYLVPQETGRKAYSLFVEALRLTNKVAIGRVVIKNKEYVVALRPFKKGIAMHILFYMGEIRDIEKLEELQKLVVVSDKELELARALVQKLSESEFNISKFKDRYAEVLKELIEAKAKGKEFEIKEEEKEETKSLMEALKASVEAVGKKKEKK